MLMNITIAAALMVATTAIHAGGMVLAMSALRAQGHSSRHRLKYTRVYWVCGIVLLMFIVSLPPYGCAGRFDAEKVPIL